MRLRMHFSRRHLLFAALAAVMVAYLGLVLGGSRWLRTARMDLTADQLYTLTPGTLHIVEGLHRPLKLTLYFSDHAARDLPQLRSYEQRVREMLQEMVARARGRLRLQIIDPVPYSDDEASAEGNGLDPASGGSNGERVFFGLVGTSQLPGADPDADVRQAGRTLTISFFEPSREVFLEYDIAKLLYELDEPAKPRIGVLSSLPVQGDPKLGEQPWLVMQQLAQQFTVDNLDAAKLKQIDPGIQALLLIHPKHLPADALYALDQYVLRGGHLVVFVDPYSELDDAPYVDSNNGVLDDHNSDLPKLFADWGVAYDSQRVLLDRSRALSIELAAGTSLSDPAMLGLGSQELNRNDVITASLQRVNISAAGYFDLVPNTSSRLIPLLQSSTDAAAVPAQRVRESTSDPSILLDGYKPDDVHYVVAARLRGAFASAFPERAGQPGHLAQAKRPTEVILVADTDLLSDRLWVTSTQTLLGLPQLSALANNGDFITNIVDNLSGSSALLSIHGRSTSQRPFTRVLALRNAANQKFLAKEQDLERELVETRRRLAELQPAKGTPTGGASVEQKTEVEQFLQRQLAINRELREVQHQLNAEIDALGLRLKFLNIVLMPLLVALAGLFYGWRRSRQNRPHL